MNPDKRNVQFPIQFCQCRWVRLTASLAIACLLQTQVTHAQRDHEQLLQKAERAAEAFRAAEESTKPSLKDNVEKLVGESFDARQAEQLEKLEAMRKTLEETKQAIESRQELRERIVARKVEDLLTGRKADWLPNQPKPTKSYDLIKPGDMLMIHIEGILPFTPPGQAVIPPPVHVLESGRLVLGFPKPVGNDGKVSIPLLGLVDVNGLGVREAEERIAKLLVDRDILRADRAVASIMLVPEEDAKFRAANAKEESVTIVQQAAPIVAASAPAGSSFDDVYGRVEAAMQLVNELRDAEAAVEHYSSQNEEFEAESNELRKQAQTAEVESAIQELNRLADLNRSPINERQRFVETKRLRLKLDRDYLRKQHKFLAIELEGSSESLQTAEQLLKVTQLNHKNGTGHVGETLSAQLKVSEAEKELRRIKQDFETVDFALEQWNSIVGDLLD
ncbi:MAG: polysaccharide biosynthesis/export family protein [Planctomycetota bacterium]